MTNKNVPLADLSPYFQQGQKIALGGQSVHMNPVQLIRQVLLSGCRKLNLVASPVGGFAADLMIGAGAVESIEFAQMGLWEYGLAPNLRRYSQENKIKCVEHT